LAVSALGVFTVTTAVTAPSCLQWARRRRKREDWALTKITVTSLSLTPVALATAIVACSSVMEAVKAYVTVTSCSMALT